MTRATEAAPLTPVILCGGVGGRLWPVSRAHAPKQFMPLTSDRTMLQETLLRIADPSFYNPPIVVCGDEHRFLAAEQIRQLGVTPAAVILEPVGRSTAPAIALAALKAAQAGKSSIIVIMPADHLILDGDALTAAIKTAAVAARDGRIVTLGIKPTYPATGYGYISAGQALDAPDCFAIERFLEKPNLERAKALVEERRHYWNAGIFIGYPEVFIAELEAQCPDVVEVCKDAIARGSADLDFYRPFPAEFAKLRSISIDHAIMEKTAIGAVVPVEMGWSDIGSWGALWDLLEKDSDGNGLRGPVHVLDTRRCYLRSEGPLLAALGLEDLIVIADVDAVLVAKRSDGERIKVLLQMMKAAKRQEVDVHRIVYRPWGSYEPVVGGDGFQVKRIIVKPHAKLSLQRHQHRAEHWVVVRGEALVTRGSDTFRLSANQSTYIPLGEVHRLENDCSEPLHVIEVQSGSYLGEDDIVRLEDNYGRGTRPD